MVASAITKGNGFGKNVCRCVDFNVRAVCICTAYGVNSSAICIEYKACISCIESNAGSCIKIKSYSCNNAAVIIGRLTADSGSANVITDNRLDKCIYSCNLGLQLRRLC